MVKIIDPQSQEHSKKDRNSWQGQNEGDRSGDDPSLKIPISNETPDLNPATTTTSKSSADTDRILKMNESVFLEQKEYCCLSWRVEALTQHLPCPYPGDICT